MELLNALQWRYATKRMTGAEVPSEKVDRILEAIQLAPSCFGLQPYSVIVVKDPEQRSRIREQAANQPQVEECSHLLVFAAWDPVEDQSVTDWVGRVAEVRDLPVESLSGLQATIAGSVGPRSREERFQWAVRQAYIGLGMAVAAAATMEVDASPMEGFSPEALDECLGLRARALRSVVLLALGYRDAKSDRYASAKKVRWPREKTILQWPFDRR